MGTVSAETDIQDNSVDLISNIGTESDVQDVSVDLVANTDSIASDVQDVSVDLIANSDSGLNLSSLSSSENGKTYEIYEADDWADAWVDMRDYSGTITLNINKNLDITYALEDDKYQYNNKFASKTLIINGNNHQIRSDNDFNFLHDFFELGNNQRFLEIYGDKRVILNNIRFDGFGLRIGHYRGALIYMAGSSYLEMNNCHINGVFVGCNGLGVITLRGESTLKMINTTLQNTQNIWGANSASAGVYLNDPGTSAEIFNCTFKNLGNSTHNPNWGGAICTYGKLYCDGCTFSNLTAGYGAAISIHDYKSQVAIQNSNFIDCKAVYTGIINVEGSEAKDIKLTKCSFINNKVLSLKNYASLIYLNNRYEEISLTKCIFYNSNPDNVNIVYLAATGNNQKIILDQCFRFNYNNIGNTNHGTWSQSWVTQEFEGDNTARLYDIKNYTLVFKDPNGRIVNDMPNCPALPIKIMANNNEVLRTSVVPMNQNNKGTFEVKFNQFADHLFYTYKPTDSNLVFCKRVRLVNGYVSLDTNLVKDGVTKEKIKIATKLAKIFDLSEEEINKLRIATTLYDIGNLMLPQELLLKSDPLTDDEKAALTLADLKRTNSTIYYIRNVDNTGKITYSRYYLTDKEIAKFYILNGTYTSASTLFAGLNGTYDGNKGQYNLHEEKGVLVPVSGYRGEMVNVTLTNNTFFPTDAVFSGSNLNLSDATVTGYIFNCWEKVDENNWKKIENIVPIPYMQ